AGMRAGFRACYQRGLDEKPNIAGSVSVALSVGAQGAVTTVRAAQLGSLSEAVVSCVAARARVAQFDAPDGGSAQVQFRVILQSVPETVPVVPEPSAAKPAVAKPVRVANVVATPAVPKPSIGDVGHAARPCARSADLPLIERKLLWRERLSNVDSV